LNIIDSIDEGMDHIYIFSNQLILLTTSCTKVVPLADKNKKRNLQKVPHIGETPKPPLTRKKSPILKPKEAKHDAKLYNAEKRKTTSYSSPHSTVMTPIPASPSRAY